LSAGIGSSVIAWDAPSFELAGKLLFHDLRKAPGSVDEEDIPISVFEGERWSADFEKEDFRAGRNGFDWIGVKFEVAS